jgi:hypothetical protein
VGGSHNMSMTKGMVKNNILKQWNVSSGGGGISGPFSIIKKNDFF